MTQTLFNEYNKPSAGERKAMTDFLHAHLEEFRDSKEDMIRWSHAILSVNSKNQFVDLAILYSPTQEKRLPFRFGPPTKSMVIFFS